jgi:PEGA domain-containing protein
MKHCIAAAAVLVWFVAGARVTEAQVRNGGGQQQQPGATHAPRAPQSPAPAPGSRFTSTLRSVPPPPDVRPTPFVPAPFVGQTPFFTFGRFAFWPWGAWLPIPLYSDYTTSEAYGPPLEGAPAGGVQLDIDPRRAQVFVDGTYVGLVGDFSGYYHHLELPAGPHDIAVVSPGYEPLNLHVLVAPGATLTHRATLARAYGR